MPPHSTPRLPCSPLTPIPYSTPPHQSPVSEKSIPSLQSVPSPGRSYLSPSSSPPRSPHTGRPLLPRSSSSTTYMHKPRRSPDFTPSLSTISHVHEPATSAAVTPSAPVQMADAPVSPPDSAHNSSDDEAKPVTSLEQLHEAVRRLEVNRSASPIRGVSFAIDGKNERPHTPPGHLSATARKISHSRSSTETSLLNPSQPSANRDDGSGSGDDFEDEENLGSKPPLIRKKSGELVKPAIRPRSRRKHSSMPGTPTYSKAVHFNDDIEQVRHFLQAERPIAVSAGTSPVETHDEEPEFPWFGPTVNRVELDAKLLNFPRDSLERQSLPVQVEKLWMSSDKKHLLGTVAVANLAFHKHVAARFTFDNWRTTSEVVAEYDSSTQHARRDGFDPFHFSIKLSDQGSIDTKTLLLCVRYFVNGKEYWDNNNASNFQVEFCKREIPAPSQQKSSSGATGRPAGPPRSRHNSPASRRPRSMPSFEDDFSSGFDGGPGFKFRNFANQAKPMTLPDTPPAPKPKQNGAGQQFASRYDFGASLSQALSTAQVPQKKTAPGAAEVSRHRPTKSDSSAFPLRPPPVTDAPSPRPDTLLANRQTLDSQAYQEFVSKFCFFGSGPVGTAAGGVNAPANSPVATPSESTAAAAGAAAAASNKALQPQVQQERPQAGSKGSDGARDDDFPAGPVHITDNKGQTIHIEHIPSTYAAPRKTSRSQSPASRDVGMHAPSHRSSFGYPYSGPPSFFSGSATPPAIRS